MLAVSARILQALQQAAPHALLANTKEARPAEVATTVQLAITQLEDLFLAQPHLQDGIRTRLVKGQPTPSHRAITMQTVLKLVVAATLALLATTQQEVQPNVRLVLQATTLQELLEVVLPHQPEDTSRLPLQPLPQPFQPAITIHTPPKSIQQTTSAPLELTRLVELQVALIAHQELILAQMEQQVTFHAFIKELFVLGLKTPQLLTFFISFLPSSHSYFFFFQNSL